jgi:hypothetical protein
MNISTYSTPCKQIYSKLQKEYKVNYMVQHNNVYRRYIWYLLHCKRSIELHCCARVHVYRYATSISNIIDTPPTNLFQSEFLDFIIICRSSPRPLRTSLNCFRLAISVHLDNCIIYSISVCEYSSRKLYYTLTLWLSRLLHYMMPLWYA